MGKGSEWLSKGQLVAFIEQRGGREQTANELWRLITTRFPSEVLEVYGCWDVFEFRHADTGEIEVTFASLRAAMEYIDPCWIRGYGQTQHRWLIDWLATF